MKTGLAVLAIVLTLLLVSGLAQAQPAREVAASAITGASTGGGFQLTSQAWQARGASGSPGYRLETISAPASSENGCCCIYLPCVRKP